MDTLLLDRTTWDLCLDAAGNIAVASNPYALAQDAASAIKTFLNEVYYDTTLGIPYFQHILGQPLSRAYVKTQMIAAAMTVPEVILAECFLSGFVDRTLTGQVQITDRSGAIAVATF
jgi:hypothetical protein